jgi:hypothetical protein
LAAKRVVHEFHEFARKWNWPQKGAEKTRDEWMSRCATDDWMNGWLDVPGSARRKRFEMELKMVSTSVVVLSEGNNPRLLNPDFLERNRIVSAEWKAQDVVVTPPFAQVVYISHNG